LDAILGVIVALIGLLAVTTENPPTGAMAYNGETRELGTSDLCSVVPKRHKLSYTRRFTSVLSFYKAPKTQVDSLLACLPCTLHK